MPRTVGSDLNISITTTRPFSQRKAWKVQRKSSIQEVLNQDMQEELSGGNDISTETKVVDVDMHRIKLPVLPRTRRVNNKEHNDLQVLLRGIQCFDFSLQELTTECTDKSSKKSQSSCSQRNDVATNITETAQERAPFVSGQNHEDNSEGEFSSAKDSTKDKSSVLPLSCSILEGQRVNLRAKLGLNKQRKDPNCQLSEKGNKLSNQSDSTSEGSDIENILTNSIDTRRTSSKMVSSLKTGKPGARPVFHLPKADKYDITPRNIITSKVCSVFKVNDLKTSSLFYSGYKNTWIPRRGSYVIKNSVFKSIARQPVVYLRQPSPVAGVKMTLKEHEDSLASAIQTVEETNIRPPPVDAEVSRQIKKFVIRLPPIC